MRKIIFTICLVAFFASLHAQVAINRDGTPVSDTSAMLEIKKALKSKLKVRSTSLQDTSVLELSNRNTGNNFGTDFLISARREQGIYFTTTSDLLSNINDSLLTLRTNGNIGIGNKNPLNKLDVAGNINLTGTIKTNGVTGQPNQILGTNSSGNLSWINKGEISSSSGGNVGYGSWGDCSINNIGEYNPVGDSTGLPGDYFGGSVAVSGNFAIIGAPFDEVGANAHQGSASIYRFNGTSWEFMQKITEAGGAALDTFGFTVAIFGNFAIVGIKGDNVGTNPNQGSANIYQYNGSSWVFLQKLIDPTGAANDGFGNSVAISGNNAVVGAMLDDDGSSIDEGSAAFFLFNGSTWVFTNKVTGPGGAAGDHFGYSVSISNQYAIIGAPLDDGLASNSGSATTYDFNGSTWSLMQKLSGGSTELADDNFGSSVSISGNFAIVGAINDHLGGILSEGSATIYKTNGSVWMTMVEVTNGSTYNDFGTSVSISGNYAIISYESVIPFGGGSIGATMILVRVGAFWQRIQEFGDPFSFPNNGFGASVAIDGNNKRFLIGVPGFGAVGKTVFGKVN